MPFDQGAESASTTTPNDTGAVVDWDLQGRTVKALLKVADDYDRKAQDKRDSANNDDKQAQGKRESAAYILRQAKEALPRGQFDPWLEKHGIARSTAYRLIQENEHPESIFTRRQYQSRKNEEAKDMRRQANRPMHETKAKPQREDTTEASQAHAEADRQWYSDARVLSLLLAAERLLDEGACDPEALALRIADHVEEMRTRQDISPDVYSQRLNAARLILSISEKLRPLIP